MENDEIRRDLAEIKTNMAVLMHDFPRIEKQEVRIRKLEDRVMNNSLVLRAALAVTGVVGSAAVAVAFSVIKEMV